jgi:Zn-dependent M28 family amino/carboxypeptidase
VKGTLYLSAVDNASGTVAMMEIARIMDQAAAKGYRPRRTILFGLLTGEEKGMIGSFWYVNHPVYPVKETHTVLNIDMPGRVNMFYSGRRPDSNYAYILVMDSVKGFRKDLIAANDALTQLKLDTYYEQPGNMRRRLLGSDQFPFWQQGVPFVRIDCGFAKDYHMPTDTPDKINFPLLTEQTKLTFLTLWNMADK